MHRYFSTPPIFSAPVTNINRELGIIQGITIARIGPAKGHNGFIDRTFLLQIIDNAASRTAGVKARFGHPNMCSSALGSYLGRFKNYSYSGDQVKADLHLDETAKKTPAGDLYSYILEMAEKNPDMFGASIVFEIAESVFLQEEVEGQKVEKEYFRLKELKATDIVDDPAATDGLFSANTFPGIATQFLDENPEIMDLIFSKPDSIVEFLSNYITYTKMNLSSKIKENFAAFQAAFSTTPSIATIPDKPIQDEPISESDTVNSLFVALCATSPRSFTNVNDYTPQQKVEALTSHFHNVNDRLINVTEQSRATMAANEEISTKYKTLLEQSDKLSEEFKVTQDELEIANTRIQELTLQLSARPSIPLNVTDPAVSLTTNQVKDETGKQILAAIPIDLKRKLASNTQ